jgi:hypothetical protein
MDMIDEFRFGLMVINGQTFTKDLIIYPNYEVQDWWRYTSHECSLDDVNPLLQYLTEKGLDCVIFGTGFDGRMTICDEIFERLEKEGIPFEVLPTNEAGLRYNKCFNDGKQVAGVFHITC